MKIVGHARTNVAALVLVDRQTVTEIDKQRLRGESSQVLDELETEGRLCFIKTGVMGVCSFHLYLDEEVPQDIFSYIGKDEIPSKTFESFAVPSGLLWFTGEEDLVGWDDPSIKNQPPMGAAIDIPPGHYRAEILWLDYLEDFQEDLVEWLVGAEVYAEYEKRNSPLGNVSCAGCLLTLIAAVLLLATQLSIWTLLVGGAALFAWGYVKFASGTPRHKMLSKQIDEAYKEIESKYPTIIAQFMTVKDI